MKVLTMQHITFFSFEVTHIFKTYTLLSKRVKHIFFYYHPTAKWEKYILNIVILTVAVKGYLVELPWLNHYSPFYFLRKGFC